MFIHNFFKSITHQTNSVCLRLFNFLGDFGKSRWRWGVIGLFVCCFRSRIGVFNMLFESFSTDVEQLFFNIETGVLFEEPEWFVNINDMTKRLHKVDSEGFFLKINIYIKFI